MPFRSPWRRAALLGLGLATLASTAAGQPAAGKRWVLAIQAQGGYQSDVSGLAPDEGDVLARLGARLGYRFEVQRLRGEVGGGVGTVRYRQFESRNQLTWIASLQAAWDLSRRTGLEGRVGSSFGYGQAYSGVEDPAIPPDVLRRRDVGSALLRHGFSRTLDGVVEFHGDRYDIDSDVQRLGDGWRATGRAGLEYSRRPDALLSAFGEYERTATAGQKFEVERLLVGWSEPVERWLVLSLGGGVARYRPIDLGPVPGQPSQEIDPEPTVTPTGGAEMTLRLGDHTVAARAARTVGQVFGFGAVGASRELSLRYSVDLTSRLGFNAYANDVEFLEGAAVPTLVPLRNRSVRVGFRYGLTRRLDAQVDYSYWWRGEGSDVPGRHTVWVGVRRDFTWR